MVKSPPIPTEARRSQDILGLSLFFLGAACLLWLAFRQNAPIPDGAVRLLRLAAGSGAFVVPVACIYIGSMLLVGFDRLALTHSSFGSLLLFLTFVTWRHLGEMTPIPPGSTSDPNWLADHVAGAGGYLGALFGTVFDRLFGGVTSRVFLTLMSLISVVLMTDRPFLEVLRRARRPADLGLEAAKRGVAVVKESRERKRLQAPGPTVENLQAPLEREGYAELLRGRDDLEETAPEPRSERTPRKRALVPLDETLPEKADPSEHDSQNTSPPVAFRLPPLNLLKEAAVVKRAAGEAEDGKAILEQTLEEFGIKANVVKIAQGPSVTRYEVQLAPGIKVSKIVSLADNLAMSLAAIDVRVEAPIPGKSAIGVEVPTSSPALVTLRECLDTPEYQNAPSKLTIALGKDVAGLAKFADLVKMPHLLIGGSTNSGKSACLNSLIASLLYRSTPRELKLLLIDPKRVELSLWDGIPHLMHPVIKDVKQAAGIFRAALKEMERRYDLFVKLKTRDIGGYNRVVSEEDRLPYVVIVVDELADLMMQAAAEVETSITRLAQLARATGIHLVIATQRPSVDVITGTIKANIASRIAFTVSSQIDSRTILDMNGAERLIGRGDMLFLPIEASKPVRIQGCYIGEEETNALVAYLKEQERPNYTLTPVTPGFGGGPEETSDDADQDDLFEPAVRLVVANGHASTSLIQRKFRIGYGRAARLIDAMESRGVVSPLDGSKPREVIMSRGEAEAMFGGGLQEEDEALSSPGTD